jgi:hypothetical protein
LYVDKTAGVLAKLQAQVQLLMRQSAAEEPARPEQQRCCAPAAGSLLVEKLAPAASAAPQPPPLPPLLLQQQQQQQQQQRLTGVGPGDVDDDEELGQLALPSYSEMRRSAAPAAGAGAGEGWPTSAPLPPAAAAAMGPAWPPPAGLTRLNAARVPGAFRSAAAPPSLAALARVPGPSLGAAGWGPADGAAPAVAAAVRRCAGVPCGHTVARGVGGARGPELHPEEAAASMSFLLHVRPARQLMSELGAGHARGGLR